jgi:hypothetical protein
MNGQTLAAPASLAPHAVPVWQRTFALAGAPTALAIQGLASSRLATRECAALAAGLDATAPRVVLGVLTAALLLVALLALAMALLQWRAARSAATQDDDVALPLRVAPGIASIFFAALLWAGLAPFLLDVCGIGK